MLPFNHNNKTHLRRKMSEVAEELCIDDPSPDDVGWAWEDFKDVVNNKLPYLFWKLGDAINIARSW